MKEKLYECLHSFIEHYLIYYSIKEKCDSVLEVEKKQFLVVTSDANLQMCFVLWCKIFGSERNNKLHWKKYVPEEDFYSCMNEKYDISKRRFDEYSKDMQKFRNKYVSHADNYDCPIPYLEMAIDAALVLDDLMKNSECGIPFGTLASYFEVTLGKYDKIINTMIRQG